MGDDDDFGAAPAAQVADESEHKGTFEFPNEAVDLIGLFLDADIRYAREKVHQRIENGQLNAGTVNIEGGRVVDNRPMTQAAQKVAKVVTDVQAIQKQAQRNQKRR
jgi:hypothetical protein